MWNTLEDVAFNQNFDLKKFKDFALERKIEFGLDKYEMVSTWDCDNLIKEYKKFRGKEFEAERKLAIEQRKKLGF